MMMVLSTRCRLLIGRSSPTAIIQRSRGLYRKTSSWQYDKDGGRPQRHSRKSTFSSSSIHKSIKEKDYFDVVIVGGGAVGCGMARLLHETIPSASVALLEARESVSTADTSTSSISRRTPRRIPHPRSYALSPHSLQVLGTNVTDQLPMGSYDAMQVWQANSPASVTFSVDDLLLPEVDHAETRLLGACVEDGPLVDALWKELETSDRVTCQTGTKLERIVTTGTSHGLAHVETNHGQQLETSLLVAADGGNSWIRKALSIDRSGCDYEDQQALTFTVELANGMQGRAFQRFLPNGGGPMALLPTFSPTHAVVVWSTHPDMVRYWKEEATPAELVDHLNQTFLEGPQRIPPLFEGRAPSSSNILSNLFYGAEKVLETVHYGMAMASHHPQPKFVAPPTITGIVSPHFSFPLSCYQADQYVKNRVALIGDAAHTVHPMAGQGLNLGLSDVDVLVNTLQKAHGSGMDLSTFLSDYETHRKRNVTLSLGGIHALQRLFVDNPEDRLLQHAKTFGMNAIQNLSPLRRQLAMAATQGVQF